MISETVSKTSRERMNNRAHPFLHALTTAAKGRKGKILSQLAMRENVHGFFPRFYPFILLPKKNSNINHLGKDRARSHYPFSPFQRDTLGNTEGTSSLAKHLFACPMCRFIRAPRKVGVRLRWQEVAAI